MMDNTVVSEHCRDLEYLTNLYVFMGRPQNLDDQREVLLLVNHGYAVGFSPARKQPVWAAYRVAGSDRDVDFDRPLLYYDDARLPAHLRIGPQTFGRHDDVAYDVGHMVPNEATNRQFGRLAQMETFFMSNMSPQRSTLNRGLWKKLEDMIRNIEDDAGRDHIWAVVGPVFSPDPTYIDRPNGTRVPVPESYYCITVDPFRYPYNSPANVDILYLLIPQNADSDALITDFEVSREEIEQATRLRFFPQWTVERVALPIAAVTEIHARHRLAKMIGR